MTGGVDLQKRRRLLETIASQPPDEALVTIDQFFDGNDDLGSIGCNLAPHPGLHVFRETLKMLEARRDVSGVWIEIYDTDEGDWPSSETVLVCGEIPLEVLAEIALPIAPSEVRMLEPSRRSAGRRLTGEVKVLWWD
jgi:hypothetical protein